MRLLLRVGSCVVVFVRCAFSFRSSFRCASCRWSSGNIFLRDAVCCASGFGFCHGCSCMVGPVLLFSLFLSRISVVPGGYRAVIHGALPRTTSPADTYVGCLALFGHAPEQLATSGGWCFVFVRLALFFLLYWFGAPPPTKPFAVKPGCKPYGPRKFFRPRFGLPC